MGFMASFDSLLGNQVRFRRILQTERENREHIYMYLIDDTWVSFQRSAYLLHLVCPRSTDAALRVRGCLYPVVATFVKRRSLVISSVHADYQESGYQVRVYKTDLAPSGYAEWVNRLTSAMSGMA